MLKKFALFISVVYSICLLVISLIKLDKFPKVEVDSGDKIFHFLAYMVLNFLWFYTCIHHYRFKKMKALVFALVFSVLFGIIIEVFQNTFTTYRTLDANDITANTLGVLLMTIILAINKKTLIK